MEKGHELSNEFFANYIADEDHTRTEISIAMGLKIEILEKTRKDPTDDEPIGRKTKPKKRFRLLRMETGDILYDSNRFLTEKTFNEEINEIKHLQLKLEKMREDAKAHA